MLARLHAVLELRQATGGFTRHGLRAQGATLSRLAQPDPEDVTSRFNAKSESAFRLLPVYMCQVEVEVVVVVVVGGVCGLALWQVCASLRGFDFDRIIWIWTVSLAVIVRL